MQHSAIPDGKRHEPKGISTAANKTVYLSNGAGSGSWSRIHENDLEYADKTKNIYGWNDISDSLYTPGAPMSISSGVRTLITNNGLAPQTDTTRLGAIWNTSLNQFLINDLNAFYLLRTTMKVKAAAAAGTPYALLMEWESASGPTVISGSTQFIKGGNYENNITLQRSFYNGSVINNAPLKIYVTPDTNITLYTLGFLIQRTYKET